MGLCSIYATIKCYLSISFHKHNTLRPNHINIAKYNSISKVCGKGETMYGLIFHSSRWNISILLVDWEASLLVEDRMRASSIGT